MVLLRLFDATVINIPHWNIIDCRPNRLIKVTVVSLVPAA